MHLNLETQPISVKADRGTVVVDYVADACRSHVRFPSSVRCAFSSTIERTGSVLSACLPALIEAAERTPEVADFLHGYNARRRQTLIDVIRAGIDNGELGAYLDPELTALTLVYCRTMTPDPFPAARVRELVTQVLGP